MNILINTHHFDESKNEMLHVWKSHFSICKNISFW